MRWIYITDTGKVHDRSNTYTRHSQRWVGFPILNVISLPDVVSGDKDALNAYRLYIHTDLSYDNGHVPIGHTSVKSNRGSSLYHPDRGHRATLNKHESPTNFRPHGSRHLDLVISGKECEWVTNDQKNRRPGNGLCT